MKHISQYIYGIRKGYNIGSHLSGNYINSILQGSCTNSFIHYKKPTKMFYVYNSYLDHYFHLEYKNDRYEIRYTL